MPIPYCMDFCAAADGDAETTGHPVPGRRRTTAPVRLIEAGGSKPAHRELAQLAPQSRTYSYHGFITDRDVGRRCELCWPDHRRHAEPSENRRYATSSTASSGLIAISRTRCSRWSPPTAPWLGQSRRWPHRPGPSGSSPHRAWCVSRVRDHQDPPDDGSLQLGRTDHPLQLHGRLTHLHLPRKLALGGGSLQPRNLSTRAVEPARSSSASTMQSPSA